MPVDYAEYLDKSDEELIRNFTGGQPGSPHSEAMRVVIDTRNARRMADMTDSIKLATWIIAGMAAIQAISAVASIYY